MTKMQNTDGLRALNDHEIDFAVGGASLGGSTIGMSVDTAQRIAIGQQLEAAYAKANPFAYYGYFG